MNFLELVKKRYSARSYTEQKIEKEKLEATLEAAHVAPTAANLQPVHLIAAQSEEGLAKIGYSDEEAADPERHSQARIPVYELVSYEIL